MSEPTVDPGPAQFPPPEHRPSPYGPPVSLDEEPARPPRSHRRLLLAGIALVVVAAAAVVALAVLDPTLFGGTVLDRGAVERDVAGQFQQREGVAVTLSCPEEMALVAGGSYRCTGTTATGERVPIRIVVTDAARAGYSWTLR
jgi:hypothetical protein